MTTSKEFREFGTAMLSFIVDYNETIRDRRVLPSVQPGYLQNLIPEEAPDKPEDWKNVFSDIERVIMPGVTHWNSPNFHAYFAAGNSYPSVVAEMLSAAIGCVGFSWIASPACTELEMAMMNWLGKMLQLPEQFLFQEGGSGGGVIQGSASEGTLLALLTARSRAIAKYKEEHPDVEEKSDILPKLVAYGSKIAHSSVERAGLLGGVKMRLLDYDESCSLRGEELERAIKEDKEKGLIPFYLAATLGSTACLSFDNILELGPICEREGIWLHVDAAYAGNAFICPEFRPMLDGIELVDSFVFNPHKWMLVNFDCSAMFVKNSRHLAEAFEVDPIFLKHKYQGKIPDYRHWQLSLGRRFRSLKLWFVFRLYGQEGLRNHIRDAVQLAKEFESYMENDDLFEITHPVTMGLVCFRLKGDNDVNKKLLDLLNEEGLIHLTPAQVDETYFLRMAMCSRLTTSEDINTAYSCILRHAKTLLGMNAEETPVKNLGTFVNRTARPEKQQHH